MYRRSIGALALVALLSGLHAASTRAALPIRHDRQNAGTSPAEAVTSATHRLRFEPNVGQWPENVAFRAVSGQTTIFITRSGLTIQALDAPVPEAAADRPAGDRPGASESIKGHSVRFDLLDAAERPEIIGENELPGSLSLFLGSDSTKWRTDIPTYGSVRVRGAIQGASIVYYDRNGALEYDVVLEPGGDPGSVRFGVRGADSLRVDAAGDLVIGTSIGDLRQHRPYVYQLRDGRQEPVHASFTVGADGTFGFQVGVYDPLLPLVIDPILAFSSTIGGDADDYASAVAVDRSGAIYVAGSTGSTAYPTTPGPFETNHGGDILVTKLDATGASVVYSARIGGSGHDEGFGIAVDAGGNACVAGYSTSQDFPLVQPLQAIPLETSGSACVLKLAHDGSALLYSSILGGSQDDIAYATAIDDLGSQYICGATRSVDFPTVSGFDATLNGDYDVFVAKVSAGGASLVYSTFVGGSGYDVAYDIAVGAAGAVFLCGNTSLSGGVNEADIPFPTTASYQPRIQGSSDGFVAKLSASGSVLLASTMLGGRAAERADDLAIDPSGNICVCGDTNSSDYPVVGAAQTVPGGGSFGSYDAFVARFDPSLSTLQFSTFLGGTGDDFVGGLDVGSAGAITVVGGTRAADFPTVNAIQASLVGARDAFVTTLSPDGSSFTFSTYLGGPDLDGLSAVVRDVTGSIIAAGSVIDSSSFRAVKADFGAGGLQDALVVKLFPDSPGPAPDVPTMCSAVANDASHVLVSWTDASSNELGFRIERRPEPGSSWQQVGLVPASIQSFVDSGLAAGTSYSYRVRATAGPIDSGWSNEAVATTPALGGAPAAPSRLLATVAPGPGVHLGWVDESTNESGFEIERAPLPGGPWTPVGTSQAGAAFFVDSTVALAAAYSYRVRAVNGSGQSAWSTVASADVPPLPEVPINLSTGNIHHVSWASGGPSSEGFIVERRTPPSATWIVVGTSTIEQMTDYNTDPVATYAYRVRAYNSSGVSAPTAEVIDGGITLPTPFGLTMLSSHAHAVAITWSAGGGQHNGYAIERRTGPSGAFVTVGTTGSAGVRSFTDTTVLPLTEYTYRVRSRVSYATYAAIGYSDPSEELIVTTPGQPSPGATITVSSTADGNTRDSVLTLREAILVASGSVAVGSLSPQEQVFVAGTPAVPGFDLIVFSIAGAGTKTIAPTSALPDVADPVRIDGTTQPGYAGVPLIELAGTGAGGAGVDGLRLLAYGSSVAGICINRFSGDGVEINGADDVVMENLVIGTDPAGTLARPNAANGIRIVVNEYVVVRDCLISGNGSSGIETSGSFVQYARVTGCKIGTNAAGTGALPNGTGITLGAGTVRCTIGGTAVSERNVVSGNLGDGIAMLESSSRNTVTGNLIGTNAVGSAALGNQGFGVSSDGSFNSIRNANVISGNQAGGVRVTNISGIQGTNVEGNAIGVDLGGTSVIANLGPGVVLTASNTSYVGGSLPGQGNLIAGNAGVAGVLVTSGSVNNRIRGNHIGVTPGGLVIGQPGDGVRFESSDANFVGDGTPESANTIAGTAGAGVAVVSGTRNAVSWNVIRFTGGLPVDLGPTGPTSNDPGDADSGANDLVNAPELAAATLQNGRVVVSGSIHSIPDRSFELHFYAGPPNARGTVPVGALTVITDGSGNATFNVELGFEPASGWRLWSTALIVTVGSSADANSTSEFSNGVPIMGVGQGTDTPGVFVPSSAAFFLRNSNDPGNADLVYTFGAAPTSLLPLSGDWNGDGVSTPGLYDPATGAFFLRNSNSPGAADLVFTFGAGGGGLEPVVGDWNGDGVDTIGLYVSATGTFFLRNRNSPGAADATFGFGAGGANIYPVVGDWNADGMDTVGLYVRATGVYFLRNSNTSGAADTVLTFGAGGPSTRPIVGDWDGNGLDTIGIYLPATGTWFLRNANTDGPADVAFSYGPAGATALVGDWSGF